MAKGEGSGEGKGGFYGIWGLQRRVAGFLCCMICVGPLLIIIGISVMGSATSDTRNHNIEQYNKVVKDWTSTYRAQFQAAGLSIAANGGYRELTADNSLESTINGFKPIETGSDIETYQPLKLYISISTVIPPQQFTPLVVSFSFAEDSSYTFARSVTAMDYYNYTTVMLNCNVYDTSCVSACQQKFGTWDYSYNVCYVREYLSDYCLKVSSSGANWIADTTYGGEGCYGNFLSSSLTQLSSTASNYIPFNGRITVRSVHDPYVYAAYLTGNSFTFGLSRAQKFVTGLVLIICGGVFMIPMALIVFCIRRRHHHHHTTVIYQTSPQVVYQPVGQYGSTH